MNDSSYSLGLDEAGYGPMLGPLTVGLVRLQGPEGALARARKTRRAHFPLIDDSKVVLKGSAGLIRLETTALAALTVANGRTPTSTDELLPDSLRSNGTPWYAKSVALPLVASAEGVAAAAKALEIALTRCHARLDRCATKVISSAEFNARADALLNKALIERELIEDLLLEHLPTSSDATVLVDRLGGRQRYGDWLATLHPFGTIATEEETKETSRYALAHAGRRITYSFLVKGDSRSAEVALASCLAKYHREVAMHVFNRFWSERRPDVRRTAGYTTDARRFLNDLGDDRFVSRYREFMVRRL